MVWRVHVEFPKRTDDEASSFMHRVGNLQEALFSKLREAGSGSIPLERLDRVGYAFSVDVPRKRDLKSVINLVQELAAAHIPEREAILNSDRA